MDRDPFEQVAQDTRDQIQRLSVFLQNNSHNEVDNEVNEVMQDIEETIEDLEKSLEVIERSGKSTQGRKNEVDSLKSAYEKLKSGVTNSTSSASNTDNVVWQQEEEEREANALQRPMRDNYDNPFQEQMLREQDVQLDSIHHTMTNLHLQAQTMGDELQDQGELLQDMDTNMDTIGNKLSRGRRQLEWIYERNKEKYNDCCIMLLIIALIVLLVLAFIA
ncbi:hypothetical protein ZYGR_0I02800 [Zygosaccharomyces rouxii]|uniref:t-SNARE affecting a late Golgi compartment protein 1 n=1 Tax=Zygosaccharomyces rouxii TaxID=4956 RepID=A0A1Q2ZX65_ZYGRO|nr:hypothetical protein ZYGR_0I02800 [Zygosaccharomyces rouxii]